MKEQQAILDEMTALSLRLREGMHGAAAEAGTELMLKHSQF